VFLLPYVTRRAERLCLIESLQSDWISRGSCGAQDSPKGKTVYNPFKT